MALDKVRLLVNKIRRLSEINTNGEYDSKLDELYEELNNEIESSDVTVKIVAKVEKEVHLNEVDNWEEWLVDNLINDENDSSPTELLARDICRDGEDGFLYYVDTDCDFDINVYDKNGKKICTNKE